MNFKYGIPTVSRRDFLKGGTLGLALAGAATLAGDNPEAPPTARSASSTRSRA